MNWLARNLDVVLMLLMMLAICNIGLVTSDTPISRESINTLDESWEADMVYKASQGVWSGRDFAFTYGPLWQSLSSLLPRAAGVSLGSVFKVLYLYSYWASFVFVFLASRLLLRSCPGWKRAVFLFGLGVFWLPADARTAFALFAFACYIRLLDELPDNSIGLLPRAAACSALLLLCFLMAGDCGALAAAGLASAMAAYILVHRKAPQDLLKLGRFASGFTACTAAGILAVNVWSGGIFEFRFWAWSFHIISCYRWLMAASMTPEVLARLLWTLGACSSVFLAAWLSRDEHSEHVTMRPVFVVAVVLFSCIALQKGLVRSGWGQVSQSLLPAVSMAGFIMIGYGSDKRPYVSNILVLLPVAVTVIFSGPAALYGGIRTEVNRVFWTAPPFPACPPGTYYSDQTCLPAREFSNLVLPGNYIREHSAPSDSIFVYPYENLFGVLSRRRVSAGVLQNYSIGGEYLTDLQIATLERDRPALGVYCSDEVVAWPVDGVSNFQRTAAVWLYLQSRYMTEAEPASGVAVLRRDAGRSGRCRHIRRDLWHGPATFGSGSARVPVDAGKWAAADPDFLHLRIRVQYPFWWKLAKPSMLSATIRLAGGATKTARLAVEPNHLADVWLYPWDEANLSRYFRREANQWRAPGQLRPGVTEVELRTEPYDQFSARPDSIRVDMLEGVTLTMHGGLVPISNNTR